ncbi:methyltransferase domain-containing protein [bacterium]|nr:MAG: methyltransferase domain-containing protein [bacterium]
MPTCAVTTWLSDQTKPTSVLWPKPIAQILDSLPATCVADLGCGNAGRLAELLIRRPQLSGIGIDIDPGAITAAQHERAKHRLENRLELIIENVFTTISEPHPELAKADLVMSYMMLHDLFNMPELDDNLFTKLRQSFPNAKYFVLADTCQDEHENAGIQYPVFTFGVRTGPCHEGYQNVSLGLL